MNSVFGEQFKSIDYFQTIITVSGKNEEVLNVRRLLLVTCILVASLQGAHGMLRKKEWRAKIAVAIGHQPRNQLCELFSGTAHWRRIDSLTMGDETKIKKPGG